MATEEQEAVLEPCPSAVGGGCRYLCKYFSTILVPLKIGNVFLVNPVLAVIS